MNQTVSIGDRLREERIRLGLSQTAFGEKVGVTKKTQMLYESGKRSPGATYLTAAIEAGADLDFIMTGLRKEERKEIKKSQMGARIRDERKRLGLSQAEAGEAFGVARETWGKYERGEFDIGGGVLNALVEAGADPDYIITGFRGEEFEASIKKADESPLVTDDETMAGLFAALDKPSRALVLSMARRLRELEMMEDMLRDEVVRRGGIIKNAAE